MSTLKWVFLTFVYVLAGSILSTAIFITIFFPDDQFTIALLWQVIAMSAVTAPGTLLFKSKKEVGKKSMKLRQVIHFIYIYFVVMGTAILCDWMNIQSIIQPIVLLILIGTVYFGVCYVMFRQSEKEADCINRRLRKIYPEEEKEE
jgi:fatty acid desaturase